MELNAKKDVLRVGMDEVSLRESFGKALVDLAPELPDFVVLDGDVASGTGTYQFRSAYPARFFQFGIAEQNMVAAASGFAAVGLVPVVTSFAVFMLRAYEQVRLSVAYPRRNVKLVASHPGLDVGPDGASAQALEDLAAMRAIPGMVVLSPADALEVSLATEAMLAYEGPVYMRTGRSPAATVFEGAHSFEIGKGQVIREGSDVSVIACGVCVSRALEAASMLSERGISVRVVNMPTIKPLDEALVTECAIKTACVVSAEDHNIHGGLGSAVAEVLAREHPTPMEFIGVRDVFGESGEHTDLPARYGIDAAGIVAGVERALRKKQ